MYVERRVYWYLLPVSLARQEKNTFALGPRMRGEKLERHTV